MSRKYFWTLLETNRKGTLDAKKKAWPKQNHRFGSAESPVWRSRIEARARVASGSFPSSRSGSFFLLHQTICYGKAGSAEQQPGTSQEDLVGRWDSDRHFGCAGGRARLQVAVYADRLDTAAGARLIRQGGDRRVLQHLLSAPGMRGGKRGVPQSPLRGRGARAAAAYDPYAADPEHVPGAFQQT